MGWKNVKERYRIDHHVQVTQRGICIGSAYIHDLIVIGLNGVIIKPYRACEGLGWGVNPDLKRYETEMLADLEALRKAVLEPDTLLGTVRDHCNIAISRLKNEIERFQPPATKPN